MKRRDFLLSAGAAGALGVMPSSLAAQGAFASRRMSVVVQGNGPDVILIPGLAAGRAIWTSTVAALPGYRYHLVQVAGFAGSPAGANASGPILEPLVAELARYIAEAGLGAPAIVGHSMGGILAMMLAVRYPARVGRLMVVDMLPEPAALFGSDAAAIRPFADSLAALFSSSPEGRQVFGSLMAGFGGSPGRNGSDPDVVARAAHELALVDLTPTLGRIRAPLRVVYATEPAGRTSDPAFVRQAYRAAYAGAPTATLVAIANSGHMIMYDQAARFRAELQAFLAG